MLALVDRLSYAGNEAARRYLNGTIDRAAAAAWLERYAMYPRPRAEQRVRFIDQYRSYVINYNLGKGPGARLRREAGRPPGEARGSLARVRGAAILAAAAVGTEVTRKHEGHDGGTKGTNRHQSNGGAPPTPLPPYLVRRLAPLFFLVS